MRLTTTNLKKHTYKLHKALFNPHVFLKIVLFSPILLLLWKSLIKGLLDCKNEALYKRWLGFLIHEVHA